MGEVQVFLVRVWQHLGQFRASVRPVGQDEVWLFVEPQQLGEYLRAASTAGAATASSAVGLTADGNAEPGNTTRERRP